MSQQKAFVKNAADPKQVDNARKLEKEQINKERNDFISILKTEAGRRIIWDQLCFCGIFKMSYTGDNGTYVNEGKRIVGLRLLEKINIYSPESYGLMLKESQPIEKIEEEEEGGETNE